MEFKILESGINKMTPRQFAQDHERNPDKYRQHRDLKFFITPPVPPTPAPSPEKKRKDTPMIPRKK